MTFEAIRGWDGSREASRNHAAQRLRPAGHFCTVLPYMRGTPLVAKVTRPRPMDIRPRERLYRRIDALRRGHPVPWIVAPAGSGKTALIASYIEHRRVPSIWYRVDETDRHAEDLFHYLRLAAEAFEGNRRAGVNLPCFSPGADIDRFSRRFFDAVFERLPDRAILVLDDYHLAPEESPWQKAIERGLGHIRTGTNVVIVSRCPPPPALARPAVHGDIGLLETAELLFTEEETLALGKRSAAAHAASKLSRADLLSIHAATGGWPAGVSLLLRDRSQSAERLGVDSEVKPVFDYLARAVLAGVSDDEKRLLLHTAWLPSFTAEQAEVLAGVTGARRALRALHRSGFFLERDDSSAEVFRYHALFRSFLTHHAVQTLSPGELHTVRMRAARLLRDQGRGVEAFDLLRQTNDLDGLRELLLELAPVLFRQGRVALLERWLASLPLAQVRDNAWLEYWQSMCRLLTEPSASREGFERALERFEKAGDGTGAHLAWAGGVQALTYEGRAWRELEGWLECLERIERTCPPSASTDIGWQVASSLAMALTLVGADSATVERWCGRAVGLAEQSDAPIARVMTASVLVLNYALRGDSGLAAALVAQLERASHRGSAGFLASVAARAAATALAWHRGDAEASLVAAREGLALMGDRRVPMWQSALLVFGASAALDLEDMPQVHRFLECLADIAESGTPLEVSAYHFVRALEALARRDLSTAMVAIELSLDRDRAVGFPYGQGKDLQVVAYISFEQGDAPRGGEALVSARRLEEEHRDPVLPYWRLLLEADLALRGGDRVASIELLKSAFAIGRERQLYGGLCLPAERLAQLCRVALEEGVEPDYARNLVRRRRLRAAPPALDVPDWPWHLRVYTLGRLAVDRDGVRMSLGRSRMLPLLLKAIVALGAGGRAVACSKLVSVLWPDAEADDGTHVLEVTLLRLRKALGPQAQRAIRLEGGKLWLDPSLVWTDVGALELVLKEVSSMEGCVRGVRAESLRPLLERLLSLCTGPFDCADDLPPALLALDTRVRTRAASALRVLCDASEQLGDSLTAESAYARALEADLCTEALLPPAVRCMLRRGRRQEARALLDVCLQQGVRSEEAEALVGAPDKPTAGVQLKV
jgi:LuxR family transcriptional regulator, maltose regulon positive regulatory protein